MKVTDLRVSVYRVPTDRPEADGTIYWDSTTMVLVEVVAGDGANGLGYSYSSQATAEMIDEKLRRVVTGTDIADVGKTFGAMVASVRNVGRPGVASMAISAVDIALWDLKAKSAGLPLFKLLGPYRDSVQVYGSGGFTTYTDQELADQLAGWVSQGINLVKMKIGQDWGNNARRDLERVAVARQAIGPDAQLFVDANGGYFTKQAIAMGTQFAEYGVIYFEEPVSSDQLDQLAFIRQRVPMAVAAGEYGYDPYYFREMLRAGAVDIMQADATRCLGITGFVRAGILAHTFNTPFSAHTAPSVHAHAGCCVPQLSHVEYFYDHARIEKMFFDGVLEPVDGFLVPDPQRPGLGLEFKRQDAAKWRIAE
jgi:L-alanine-DL-glutamate epimerase-like enolase superfamily enzyme